MCILGRLSENARDLFTGRYIADLEGSIFRALDSNNLDRPNLANKYPSLIYRKPNQLYLAQNRQKFDGMISKVLADKRSMNNDMKLFSQAPRRSIIKMDYLPVGKRASLIVKSASALDAALGGLVGAGVGGGLGYGSGKILESKVLKGLSPSTKAILKSTVTDDAVKNLATGTGIVGSISGAVSGSIVANKKDNENPYKYSSADPEHGFITETNLEPFAQVPMPPDVNNAINMQHWWLKYLPAAGYGGGAASSVAKDLISGGELNKYKLLATALSSGVASHLIKNSIERHYAAPYLKNLAKEVDQKYKKASGGNEFITDTGVQLAPKDLGNKEILSVIHYRHPMLDQIPLVSAALGGITGKTLDKLTPFHSSVLGSMVGGAAGKAVQLLLTEMQLNPYRKKYVESIKKKYGVKGKHANILSFGGDILSKLVDNPIANTVNNMAIADIVAQTVKVHPTHTTFHVPYTNLQTKAPNFVHKITSGLKKKYEQTVPSDTREALHTTREFANRAADKMFPLMIAKGVGDVTGAFNKDKDFSSHLIGKMRRENELINSRRSVGNLNALETL
jgi:hypothetical protein